MGRLHIVVRDPKVVTPDDSAPYATYMIVSTETKLWRRTDPSTIVACNQERKWTRVVRWSEVCELHRKMPDRSDGHERPAFHPHSLRIGPSRLAPDLLRSRRKELESLLCAWAAAFDVSLLAERGPSVLRRFLMDTDRPNVADGAVHLHHDSAELVSKPTPSECYYSAETGWPEKLRSTTRELTVLPCSVDQAIGRLDVEVLQATGLRCVDSTLTENDVYAVIVLEGSALRSTTQWDQNQPRWPFDCARAATLPVCAPYSELAVALYHEDRNLLKLGTSALQHADVPLGRVKLRLSRLHPDTVHDLWLPLQWETYEYTTSLGLLRLRVCLSWQQPSSRAFLRYLRPPPDAFRLSFVSAAHLRQAQFAVFGPPESMFDGAAALRSPFFSAWDQRFNMDVLVAHKNELKQMVYESMDAILDGLSGVVLWRRPLLTILANVAWQWLALRPHLMPSVPPLVLLGSMCLAYHADCQTNAPAISRAPSITYQLLRLLGAKPRFCYCPAELERGMGEQCAHCGYFKNAAGFRCDCVTVRTQGQTLEDAVADALATRLLSHGASTGLEEGSASGSKGHHSGLLHAATRRNVITDGQLMASVERHGQQLARSGILDVDGTKLNPLAPYLGPVQQQLGKLLVYARATRALLRWEDSAMTLWLCAVCAVAALVLACMPWLLVYRATGVALLGPHMLLVKAHRRRVLQRAHDLERRYQASSPADAWLMVEAIAAKRALAATRAQRTAALQARASWLRKPFDVREKERAFREKAASFGGHDLVNYCSRPIAERYPLRADPKRSHADPKLAPSTSSTRH